MRLLASAVWLAAAMSFAAAAVPAVAADQAPCQLGAGPVAVDPSTAGGVNIYVTANNSVIWCSAQVIEANSDIADGTNYPLQATPDSPNNNPVSHAISVNGLLTLAHLNPASVDHTEILRLGGVGWSMLSNADLVDPSTRFEGGLKPIFWINGAETQYLRPLRSPSDTNGDDSIVTSNGAALDFYIYSGPLLNVTAMANPTQVAINQPVTFTAQVTNLLPADGALTYKWNFQDGSTATGASVKHSFAVSGTYDPVVTVQGAGNDSGGASQPVPVTVGSIPKGANPGTAGGTNPNKNSTPRGPTKSLGKTPKTAPSQNQTGGAGVNNSSGNNQVPATSQTTSPTSSTATSSTGRAHRPAGRAHHTSAARRRSSSHQQARPQRSPGTTLVDGRLVSDVIPVSGAQLAALNGVASQPSSQAHAPSASVGGGSLTPVAGIVGGGVLILLLGSGAGLELRSQRRAITPMRAA